MSRVLQMPFPFLGGDRVLEESMRIAPMLALFILRKVEKLRR
jgi:hypothetical protein